MAFLIPLFFILFSLATEESLYLGKVQKIQDFGDFDLKDLQGQKTLWYFYQPNCKSCKAQSQDFLCLPKDLKIFAIGVMGSYEATKKEFRKHSQRAIPLYGGNEWQKKLRIEQTPTLIAIDAQGHMIQRWQSKTSCENLQSVFER
ncbi:hypothetical protein K2X05_14870 [bacterium]|nr:hypothetical protein [bacterium]